MGTSSISNKELILVTVCMLIAGGAMLIRFSEGDSGTSGVIAMSLFFVAASMGIFQLLHRYR